MKDYTFSNLSPYEFEHLTRDLLQKKLSVYIESFTSGKDKGVDLKYSENSKDNIIIQAKRYSKYSNLLSNLKKEVDKVNKLNPKRYIISTSVGLTKNNKDEIINLFKPYIKSTEDIYGRDDLNNLLEIYQEIEIQYFKLWLSSTNVLRQLLDSSILGRSNFTQEEIINNINVYVQNKSLDEALEIINKKHYVIISGIPGIGKTTLAQIIAFNYLAKDYSLIDVSFDIEEAEKRFGQEASQVFYYDDFLGRNFLEKGLSKNEDRRLINFFKKVSNTKGKILLMTTREYILNQARIKYELLNDESIDIAKCILDIEKYSKLAKAQILYNHLFFSGLPQEYIDIIVKDNKYKRIIGHPNYSPRIIQLMTKKNIINKIKLEDFYDEFLASLSTPTRIWSSAFFEHISESAQITLYIIALSIRNISERDLFTSLSNFLSLNGNSLREYNFDRILKELDTTFIKTDLDNKGKHWISFSNPSIYDFLIEQLNKERLIITKCIESACFFNHMTDVFVLPEKRDCSSHQIQLNRTEANNLAKKLVEDFEILRELEVKSDNWHWKKSRLERIALLSNIFDLTIYDNIRKLVIREYLNVRIDDNFETYDKDAFITILYNVTDLVSVDYKGIIKAFFENIQCSHDAALFINLKNLSNDNFDKFCIEKGEKVIDKIKEVVADDADSNFLSDEDMVREIFEDIDTIVKVFPFIDFSTEKNSLEEAIIEIEIKRDEAAMSHYDDWKERQAIAEDMGLSGPKLENEITMMFDSLKSED